MSETYPPEGGESNVPQEPAPREVPPVTPAAPAPREVPPVMPAAPAPGVQGASVTPQPEVPAVDPLDAAGPKVKRRLNWGFAILGFVTPWAIGVAAGLLFNWLDGVGGPIAQFMAPVANVLTLGVFIGMIVAWLIGRSKDNNKLRSFGLGGIATYVAMALIGLLAFGACMVAMGG